MATKPNSYVKEVKIGNREVSIISAPLMYTEVDSEGQSLANPIFFDVYEIDFNKKQEFTATNHIEISLVGTTKITPSVTCIDADGMEIVGEVKYDIANKKVLIDFSEPVTGVIYLN